MSGVKMRLAREAMRLAEGVARYKEMQKVGLSRFPSQKEERWEAAGK